MRAATAIAIAAALVSACGDAPETPRPFEREQPNWSEADDDIAPLARTPVLDERGIERADGVWMIPVDVSFAKGLEAPVARAISAEIETARVGDDLLFAQVAPESLRVKRTLEQILQHGDALAASPRGKLARYLLGLYVHHGSTPRGAGARTNASGLLRPDFIPGELASAAELAAQAGAAFDIPRSKELLAADRVREIEALMSAIRPAIFGRPAALGDAGVGDGSPAEPADKGPSPEARAAFAALALSLEAGGLSRPRAAMYGAQLAAPAPGTVFLLGFEPAAAGGEIRGLVGVPDPEAQRILDAVAGRAVALDKIVRKEGGAKSVTEAAARGRRTRAVRDLFASGGLGPLYGRGELWRMIDGPSVEVDAGERGEVWLLTGAAAAFDRAVGVEIARGFSRDPATAALRMKWRAKTRLALLALREAAGRGTDGTETRPPEWSEAHLGKHLRVLAAMRADLAALHLALDPIAQELGIVADEECARALYEDYVGWAFESYGFGAPPADLEAAAAARRAIVRNLVASGAVEVAGGAPGEGIRYRVADFAAARSAVARLLAEVRRIRFVGDAAAAEALIDTMRGSEARWQRDIEERYRGLVRPRAVGFSYPHLRAVRGADGAIERLEIDAARGHVFARLAALAPGPTAQ